MCTRDYSTEYSHIGWIFLHIMKERFEKSFGILNLEGQHIAKRCLFDMTIIRQERKTFLETIFCDSDHNIPIFHNDSPSNDEWIWIYAWFGFIYGKKVVSRQLIPFLNQT